MKRIITFFLLVILIISCKKELRTEVFFDSDFPGARLDSVSSIGEDKYIAYIHPAFEPVNKSPWFAFGVTSESEKEIEVVLNYGSYKHRYIPKLSLDKKSWKKIESSRIKIDNASGTATLKLNVSAEKLYVAAQEIESSQDTYNWLGDIINKHPYLKKEIAGQTVLKQNNYVVTSNDQVSNAIVIVARQHPPEIPGGTIGFKAFYEELLNDSEPSKTFREKFNIITFPLLNPDGTDMGNWRHNANGTDLNRDWIDFTQPETQMVKSYIENSVEEGLKVQFALDFHTSFSGPYMLVLDTINEANSKGIIPNWINNIESNSQFQVEARKRSQELPYCYNYFFNQVGCEAVTYEDGDEIDRTIIKNRARVYARELMQTLLTTVIEE